MPDPVPDHPALAAEQLGVGVAQVCNSLVFAAPHAVLVLASGAHRVDTDLAAAALGVPSLVRATPELVRAATGFAIGGVAPLGHPAPLPTLVDADLATYDVVWAAAGHPRTVFPTSYDELLLMTSGWPAALRT